MADADLVWKKSTAAGNQQTRVIDTNVIVYIFKISRVFSKRKGFCYFSKYFAGARGYHILIWKFPKGKKKISNIKVPTN